jgi:phosphopantothenoylcysteine decarboxylase/phosphopantothenate--cysteine ligase
VLKNKNILLGVTGSVAVYKAIDLTRRLLDEGASVHVIMTGASQRFITPLSFEIASQNRVYSDPFQDPMTHITLTADADLMVIAPATANSIGKYAQGIADDMLSTCLISFRGKVVIAPAMNWRMYESPALRRNLQILAEWGVIQAGPQRGSLACGEEGIGRMSEVQDIMECIFSALSKKDLAGKRIVVTAGPTREYMDPVRFISNRSSGKMGYAVARAALRRGAEVILISGPSHLTPPSHAVFVPVETAAQMREAVRRALKGSSALIMAAAVADFSPSERKKRKMSKSSALNVEFSRTPDILSEIGSLRKRPFVVGFAAETGAHIHRARKKLIEKNADMMIFNDVTSEGSGFDVDTNEITVIEKRGTSSFPLMTKDAVADAVLDKIVKLIP